MGTGGSFLRHNDEDDVLGVEYESSHGVVKRIPIEVKPRGKLAGLKTVRSLGKSKGGSTRSALSIDLENPEVERIRKEFHMFRCKKENELTSMQKKVDKLEMQNKKLRAELLASQKTCKKLRDEKDIAFEAEHQALVRAAAFEGDRDKVQRQFKLFRETTEGELQRLLKAKRDLEVKISHLNHDFMEDTETVSRFEAAAGSGNPGDWWTALESEPSLGSTTQLHQSTLRGPEFANTMMEIGGPYINVNKDDWTVAAATLSQIFPSIQGTPQPNLIRVYVSAASDVQTEIDILSNDFGTRLKKMCMIEGRFLLFAHMSCDPADQNDLNKACWEDRNRQARCRQIEQATIFLGVLGNDVHRYTETEFTVGHLKNPGSKPAVFCLKAAAHRSKEAEELRQMVKETKGAKIVEDYKDCRDGVEQVYVELERLVKIELGLDQKAPPEEDYESENLESLCGGSLWDSNQECQQLEAWTFTKRSTCELSFEKYYEMLNSHVSTPGPLPPLLVSGAPGSGKSLLLAKWIELQQQKTGCGLVLYHFVGNVNSCEADPVIMIRRLTSQLMQHINSPPTLTCDPIRLIEEFPKWLEKVSSRIPGGVILVLDSPDRLQNVEAQFQWLLDPLPVEARVIISVQEDNCPKSWRAWPSVQIEDLSNKHVKELLRAELASLSKTISMEHEAAILSHCRSPPTCSPLYVVLLACELARCSNEDSTTKRLKSLLSTSDAVQLYKTILDSVRQEFETPETRGLHRKILRLIYAARNGIGEAELLQLLPSLTWNQWAPLCDSLMDRHILTYRAGLLIFAHQQMQQAVEQKYVHDSEGKVLKMTRQSLRDFFSQFTRPGDVTYRVADELPWLNRQLADKEQLHENILDLCIFTKLYCRGRCSELINYWHYVGIDKHSMATAYFGVIKQTEEMVGQFHGLITLPKIADVCEALGRFLKDLGLLSEALTPLQRALEIRETVLDPDHPSVAHTLHLVGGLHAQWGKLPTAEALYKQALEIYEGAFGRDHYLVARELDVLALLYQKQGKHELANPLHKRAVSIRKKCKVPRPLREKNSVDPLRRRVLQVEELAMGPDSLDLARSLNEIGVLYYLQNNVETAESFFKRSLEMRESLLGADHPDLAQSFNNLAALYNDNKQYDKAQPLYERALAIRKKHCTIDHPSVASVIKHLGMLYKKMGKLEESEPLYKEMVTIREKHFGSSHPTVATALVNLAVIYSQQGKHAEAEPLYDRALNVYEDSFGPTHPRVSETLRNLALLKYDQGDYEMAASLYRRATEIKEADPTAYSSKDPSRRSSTTETTTTMRSQNNLLNVQPTVRNY